MKTDPKKTGTKPAAAKKPTAAKKAVIKKPSDKKANTLFILVFFVLAYILYGNTIMNKWAVDDEFVTHNETVKKGLKAVPEIFSTFYVSKSGNLGSQNTDYRPIVKLTFALEYQLWGEKPGRSHMLNVLIYFFISLQLFFILKRLFRNYNILFPFLITIAFMVHPVHTEVVASLKNRDVLLAFLCGLGGLHYFIKYADTKNIRYFLMALPVFFIGYLCKSSILPFLVIYPLVLYFFTDMPVKKFFIIIGSVLGITLVAHFLPRFFLPPAEHVNAYIENPLFFEKNFWIRTGTGMVTLLFYLKLLVYPYPLVYYYGYNMIPITNWANIWVLLSFVVNAGLLVFALMKLKEKHILSFAVFFYFIFMAMYSNIFVPVVGIVAERFVFEASLGFCIAFIFLVFKLFRTDPKSLTIEFNERAKILGLIFLIMIPCVIYSVKRNRAWRNLYDLYSHDMSHLNKSAKANISYAGELMNKVYNSPPEVLQHRIDAFTPTIIHYFRQGLDIYPNNYQTLNDLATVYLKFEGQADSSIYFLKKAIALEPGLQPAWVNMGMAYKLKKNTDSAMICYNKVLSMNPGEYKATIAIANIWNERGDFEKAVKMNQDVIRDHPELDLPYLNIGNYYIMRGDTGTAVSYWVQAAQKNPTYEVCMRLSSLYRAKGDAERANYFYGLAGDATREKR